MSAQSTVVLAPPHSHLTEHRQLLKQNRYAAARVFEILDQLLRIDSVLDLGCGIGTWMQAAQAKPGRGTLGVEIETFNANDLLVPEATILHMSLGRPIDLRRKFDLVLCLETAEHLPPEDAAQLVANCARHSGVILFSAAIPGQGGLNHVNEQPPEYWQKLFDRAGFEVVDLLRPRLWCDTGIPAWYRQNMLLFVDRQATSTFEKLRSESGKVQAPLHRAHPDLLEWQARELARLKPATEPETSGPPEVKGRVADLAAELAAQREYSGRMLGEAWDLINRFRCQAPALANQEIADLRSSLSWRITAPLRAAGTLLLKLRKR